jgi:signal transduction histidine kinase
VSLSPPGEPTPITPLSSRELKHELLNAITVASGNVQAMLRRDRYRFDERDRRSLASLLDCLDRMRRVLDDRRARSVRL